MCPQHLWYLQITPLITWQSVVTWSSLATTQPLPRPTLQGDHLLRGWLGGDWSADSFLLELMRGFEKGEDLKVFAQGLDEWAQQFWEEGGVYWCGVWGCTPTGGNGRVDRWGNITNRWSVGGSVTSVLSLWFVFIFPPLQGQCLCISEAVDSGKTQLVWKKWLTGAQVCVFGCIFHGIYGVLAPNDEYIR